MSRKEPLASRLLAFACASLLLVCFSGALAQAGVPAGLADIKVASNMRYEFDLTAGANRTGTIRLENSGSSPAAVTISQADMVFAEDGEVSFAPANSTPTSNADWIKVIGQAEVPAGQSIEVPFTLDVPNRADLHGSYWSLVIVKPVRPQVVEAETANPEVRTSVEVSFQYAITVLTHVGTADQKSIQFAQPGFAPDQDGLYQLQVTLHNPGSFVVAATTWLELYDGQGALVKRVEGGSERLYPQTSTLQLFSLGELEAESYQAVVIADAGGDDVFGVRYNLDATQR